LPFSGGKLPAGNGLGSMRDLLRCREILESAVQKPGYQLLRFATLGMLVAMFLLSGCGRKGPLDPPPASSSAPPPAANVPSDADDASGQAAAKPSDFGQDGKPIAPRGAKKKLPADVLID
jgi:predicted small lipoprotein YifL